jgi:hypothetical protein
MTLTTEQKKEVLSQIKTDLETKFKDECICNQQELLLEVKESKGVKSLVMNIRFKDANDQLYVKFNKYTIRKDAQNYLSIVAKKNGLKMFVEG